MYSAMEMNLARLVCHVSQRLAFRVRGGATASELLCVRHAMQSTGVVTSAAESTYARHLRQTQCPNTARDPDELTAVYAPAQQHSQFGAICPSRCGDGAKQSALWPRLSYTFVHT